MTEAEEHTAESGTAEAHTQCVCVTISLLTIST